MTEPKTKTKPQMSFTPEEASALWILIEEGSEGILTDEAAAMAYLGGRKGIAAAIRARDKFRAAIFLNGRLMN